MSEHTTSRLNEVGRQLESAKSTLSSREKEFRELTTSHRRISEDAKTAKKVDMKRLKVVAWSILNQVSNEVEHCT